MIKTTKEIENYINPLFKLLNYPLNTPKWVALRFMMNISLSLTDKSYIIEIPKLDGKEYSLTQILGKNKEDEDFSLIYKKMIEKYDGTEFSNKELKKRVEYHIVRGYSILNNSLKSDSNIYDFLIEEFC